MSKTTRAIAAFGLIVALLPGCQSVGPNTAVGAGLGAALGGLGCAAVGGRAGACLAIATAGAIIGGAIGAQIDERDRAEREAALRRAARENRRVSWRGSKTGNRGTITPLRAVVQNGRNCQMVQETYFKDGEPVSGQTTVCS
ncbi:hypothetical protein [Rhizobium rhizosphaerae]|nr:hypothetical protein [Xaviernesmea rhizosphaerae]